MNETFHDQLIAARDKNHSKDHPFFDLWAAGKLSKEKISAMRRIPTTATWIC